ncbi:phage tail protein [Nocardia thailandica]
MNPLLVRDATKIVAWGVSGRAWHLHGPGAGREHVRITGMAGFQFAPVGLLLSEGARQDGATFLRSVRSKKETDITLFIQGSDLRTFHAVHDAWWRDWSTDRPTTVGWFTRYQGWRLQQFRLDSAPEPIGDIDTSRNAAGAWLMSVVALDPLQHHLDETASWTNSDGFNEGTIRVRNAADQPGWPRYTMIGPGRYRIGDPVDGDLTRMVETPTLEAGETLRIDTHPRHRTARVYTDATPSGRNVWGQLGGRRWLASMPPWSSTDIPVIVSDGATSAASITATLTPRSSRPF